MSGPVSRGQGGICGIDRAVPVPGKPLRMSVCMHGDIRVHVRVREIFWFGGLLKQIVGFPPSF